MKLIEITTKETFAAFCAKEFPNQPYSWDGDWCFVQAGTHLGDCLHYEFNGGKVSLHIESEPGTWRGIRNYLNAHAPYANITPKDWWGRQNGAWTLKTEITCESDFYQAFKDIRDALEYHIIQYERGLQIERSVKEAEESNKLRSSIQTVGETLTAQLRIPHYQRPYRWTKNNVLQLLKDIRDSWKAEKQTYRIGSVILHAEKEYNDIVDGQQRITTIALLLHECAKPTPVMKTLRYAHADSLKSIRDNRQVIADWLRENVETGKDREDFADYVMDNCEFVQIIVSEQSEAFQMFDSQNGRGKELEAYNLLKAFHIRAMEQNSQEERIACDVRWEAATQYDATPLIPDYGNIDILRQIFNEQLYRSRRWTRTTEAKKFSKAKIGEFKGCTIDKNHLAEFPFQNPQLLLYLAAKFYESTLKGTIATANRFLHGDPENVDPFANINQTIVNGKSFFEYVETYVELYKRLFIQLGTHQLAGFKRFYYQHCLDYRCSDPEAMRKKPYAHQPKGDAARNGDGYLREVYKSLIICLFDKFGEKALVRHYKTLYRLVYVERITHEQVRDKTADKLPHSYFELIYRAKDMASLSQLDDMLANKLKEIKSTCDKVPQNIKDLILKG